jgi:exodeoxyribonuclease V gamma subunit
LLHLCYSNRTEELLGALAERLGAERAAGASPFDPALLVVPNRNVETYVKLGLAERMGIAANLAVHRLRDLLASLAEPGSQVVALPQLEGHLLSLLHEDALPAPVREYLHAAGDAPDALDRRRCQLAAELARLFDEYALSRPEMLTAWMAGRALFGGAMEDWQRALWTGVFGRDGLVARRSQRLGVRAARLDQLLEGPVPAGRPLHLFGLSYMARGYHRMLHGLARHRDIHIYTLNPCREFWEDVETASELRRRLKRQGRSALFPTRREARQPGLILGEDPLDLTSDSESLPLRLWGRPGRENVRLLNQLTDGDFEGRFATPPPRTLLAHLQADILDRTSPEAHDLTADGTLTVLRCPGLRRELEVVAAEIWRLLAADPTLRLRDIAVVVPDGHKDAYLTQVAAVFGEALELPHSVVDLPLGGGHRLGEAVLMLLALPLGTFSRRELLPLLTHPSVVGRFPEARAADWLRLADELGIVHGADHQDHAGTYIERDLLNWDQGLRRLALGALMTGPRAGDEDAVGFGDQKYLPADLPRDLIPSALSFGLLARSLIADARFAAGKDGGLRTRPLPEWLELMRGMLTGYLVPTDEDEEALLGRCLTALDELEEVEIEGRVSYLVASELAVQALGRIGGARGQYLARGVQVASFLPMRAIPFRAVFVLGLGHGLFPATARRGQLDLREAHRAPGDVSPRERDLYLFLETLLSARERLVLSYVARDELTGETLAPSSVLLELREVLADYLPPAELAKVFDAPPPPLRRFDDETRLEAAPLARRERAARDLGRSLRATLGRSELDLATVKPHLTAAVAARLSYHSPPDRPRTAAEDLVIPLGAIRQFLEDPLQGSARFRLGMREVDDDGEILERNEEAFESDGLGRTALLREAMVAALLTHQGSLPAWPQVAGHYDELGLREELAAHLPTGLFRRAERGGHLEILRGWLESLTALSGGAPLSRWVARFGSAAASFGGAAALLGRDQAARPVDEIKLDAVTIVGRTDLIVTTADGACGSLVLSCRRDEEPHRERLRAFLDHVALSAAGVTTGAHASLVVWSRGGQHKLRRDRFRPVTRERARAYLAAVVADMLEGTRGTGVHDYLLPCEAVFARKPDLPAQIEQMRDAYLELPFKAFSTVNGPVPEAVERHDPPSAEQAAAMVERRFGLYFELLEEQP